MVLKVNNSTVKRIQKAIREEGFHGWLFCNFRHRDRLSDEILNIPHGLTNSRYWFYFVPATGEPSALVHAIEADHLDSLPGKKHTYVSRQDLLQFFNLFSGKYFAAHYSENLSAVSFLDAGMHAVLSGAGIKLVSAENLIQRFKGLLNEEGIASHERAADALYGIVEKVWGFACSSFTDKKTIYEGDLRQIIEDEFVRLDMTRDHPPLAAAGVNSGNPHYDFSGCGREIQHGDIIQLDLWARENSPTAMYADISWAGIFDAMAGPKEEKIFGDLAEAREKVFEFIDLSFFNGSSAVSPAAITGAQVDAFCRSLLIEKGYENAIKHRTGHGIDTEVHGSGANIDSVEFPDTRLLLEGSCFSLEPGLYFPGYGFRTEVDVYIQGNRPHISGRGSVKQGRQFKLLHC